MSAYLWSMLVLAALGFEAHPDYDDEPAGSLTVGVSLYRAEDTLVDGFVAGWHWSETVKRHG